MELVNDIQRFEQLCYVGFVDAQAGELLKKAQVLLYRKGCQEMRFLEHEAHGGGPEGVEFFGGEGVQGSTGDEELSFFGAEQAGYEVHPGGLAATGRAVHEQ